MIRLRCGCEAGLSATVVNFQRFLHFVGISQHLESMTTKRHGQYRTTHGAGLCVIECFYCCVLNLNHCVTLVCVCVCGSVVAYALGPMPRVGRLSTCELFVPDSPDVLFFANVVDHVSIVLYLWRVWDGLGDWPPASRCELLSLAVCCDDFESHVVYPFKVFALYVPIILLLSAFYNPNHHLISQD